MTSTRRSTPRGGARDDPFPLRPHHGERRLEQVFGPAGVAGQEPRGPQEARRPVGDETREVVVGVDPLTPFKRCGAAGRLNSGSTWAFTTQLVLG